MNTKCSMTVKRSEEAKYKRLGCCERGLYSEKETGKLVLLDETLDPILLDSIDGPVTLDMQFWSGVYVTPFHGTVTITITQE